MGDADWMPPSFCSALRPLVQCPLFSHTGHDRFRPIADSTATFTTDVVAHALRCGIGERKELALAIWCREGSSTSRRFMDRIRRLAGILHDRHAFKFPVIPAAE